MSRAAGRHSSSSRRRHALKSKSSPRGQGGGALKAQREEHALRRLSVGALSPPSLIGRTLELLGVAQVGDLLDLDLDEAAGHRGVGSSKVAALRELRERAEALLGEQRAWPEQLKGPGLLEELQAAGVELDEPWERALRWLDVRTRNVLRRGGFGALRELALKYEAGALGTLHGFGEVASARLGEHLSELVELGPQGYLWGDKGRPKHLGEAITQVLQSLDAQDHVLLVARFLQERTLEQIGEQLGVSRERVRQKLERALEAVRALYCEAFEELLEEVSEVLHDRGGLISRSLCEALCEGASREHVTLALAIVGVSARWCGSSHFLTTLSARQIEELFVRLRADIELHEEPVTCAEQLELLASRRGWPAPAEEIVAFLENRWAVSVEATTRAVSHPWTDWGRLAAETLREAGPGSEQGLDAATLRERLAERYGERASLPSARQIYASLSRREDVYAVERGRYVHVRRIGLEADQLERLAGRFISALREFDHAVSTGSLIELARARGEEVPEALSPMLLRDVMGRHPRIRLFQSTDMVAHLDVFSGKRRTQAQWLDELLLEQLEPLDCAEIARIAPAHLSYHPSAIYATLSKERFALNLGQGRFLHRQVIGLTERALEQVCDRAVSALDQAGVPQSASRLLSVLAPSPSAAYLKAHAHGASILYALMQQRAGVSAGAGEMLMNRELKGPEGCEQDPALVALSAVCAALKEAASPADLRREVEERFGWDASSSAFYHLLARAEGQGWLERDEQGRALPLGA